MPTYRYTGEPGRYYPTLGFTAGPKKDGCDGTELDADDNPDVYRFTEKTPDPPAAKKE
jgi:hypothetical protein